MNSNAHSTEDTVTGDCYRILVLDSGVGGLSICQSILALRSDVQIVYLADDAGFPYGTKDEAFLEHRISSLVSECSRLHRFDLVVLACNTISTLLLPKLREEFSIPFVGVVPAIKPAALVSQSKIVGLLATPGTIKRPYTAQLISDFASKVKVISVGSKVLVEQAESLLQGEGVDLALIDEELLPFKGEPDLDVIVLGCTHFPLLETELRGLVPSVTLIDSGEAVARRVNSLLEIVKPTPCELIHQLYFTDGINDTTRFRQSLKALGMGDVRLSVLK